MLHTQRKEGRSPKRIASLPGVIGFGLIACVLYGFGAAIRGDVGILLPSFMDSCGLAYQDVSFCVAVMNLMFGATQPFFGILATRKSNRFVLLLGAALLAASFVGMALARSFAALFVSLGILFGAGAGAISFGLVLSSAMRRVGPERAMLISGMLNAAAGMWSFVLSPTLRALLDGIGLVQTMCVLLAFAALLVPVVLTITSADANSVQEEATADAAKAEERKENEGLFRRALHDRVFLLLLAGFSTCGFHMVIIESHLYSQYLAYGIEAMDASWAFSFYGIATILGALLSGWLSGRLRKGRLLAFYYGFRAVWTLAFLFLMPKDLFGAIVFSVGLGLTGDATVSPTSGLVNARYSIAEAATLTGVLFFGHQVGAFLSAWLGGMLVAAVGSYLPIWLADVGACCFAALMSARIRER